MDLGPRIVSLFAHKFRSPSTSHSGATTARILAIFTGMGMLGAFLFVLYQLTNIVGGTTKLAIIVGAAVLLATVAAQSLPLPAGLGVSGAIFVLGLSGYLLSIPNGYQALLDLRMIADSIALVLGDMSVLHIYRADVWAILIAPAPVFATWYLILRRHYGLGAWIGGAAIVFFVLTGDAPEVIAVVGVTSALGVLGFGTLEASTPNWSQVREVGILLTAVIVVTRLASPVTASLIPTDTGRSDSSNPTGSGPGAPSPTTVEGSLLDAPGRIDVYGSISLAPTVRFTVTAERSARWRVAAYDRFTGGGWVRSGETTHYSDTLAKPAGDAAPLVQTFEAESWVNTMPAAWKPIDVDSGFADRTLVTDLEGLQPDEPLSNGDAYTVTSYRPRWTTEQLRAAGHNVSDAVKRRYLQLPNNTPDQLDRLSADITADATTVLDQVLAVERWLSTQKDYSLDVARPAGNVAEAFVFEMDRGYCVYFATAMTIMLRTLGIPARFTVGYTSGERVSDDQWVVRGFNSHAWVEVFFPDTGWVPFDPTPSQPRQLARQQRLDTARTTGESGIDTAQTEPVTTDTPQPNATTNTAATNERRTPETDTPSANGSDELPSGIDAQPGGIELEAVSTPAVTNNLSAPGASSQVTRRDLFTTLPDDDQVALLAGLVGTALGLNKFGLLRRGHEFVQLRWQEPTDSPLHDIERAFERLERTLGQRFRERHPSETRRSYIEHIETTPSETAQLQAILETYEAARYRGIVDREAADEVIHAVDGIVHEHLTLSGVFDWSRREG